MPSPSDFLTEQMDTVEEILGRSRAAAQDPSVPVGAHVTQASVSGVPISEVKTQTYGATTLGEFQSGAQSQPMTMANGQSAPERIAAYHRLRGNEVSMIPFATWQQQLAKVGPDGKPVYSLKPWPGVQGPVLSDLTCDICLRRSAGTVRKKFHDDQESDADTKWEAHMQAFHSGQYATILRRRESDERRAERDLLLQVLNRLAPVATAEPASPEALMVEQARDRLHEIENAPEVPDVFVGECSVCDWHSTDKDTEAKAVAAVRMHKFHAHKEPSDG